MYLGLQMGKHSTTRWYISTVPITDRRRTNIPQYVRHTVDLLHSAAKIYHVPNAQKKKRKCASRDDRVNEYGGRLMVVVVQDLLLNKGRSLDCIVKLQGRVTFRIALHIFHEQLWEMQIWRRLEPNVWLSFSQNTG
jgi:hypothetical protein